MARRRGTATSDCVYGGGHHPPHIDPAGAVALDWSTHRLSPSGPCRQCGRGTVLRDCTGGPIHKVCAELELAADIRIARAERASDHLTLVT